MLPEAFDEQPVPKPAIADRQRVDAELLEHGAYDQGAREDDRRPLRLEPHDRPALVGRPGSIAT